MAASHVFKRAVYVDQNAVATEYYQREVGNIFEKEDDAVKIEVRCRSACDLRGYQKRGTSIAHLTTTHLMPVEPSEPQSGLSMNFSPSEYTGKPDHSTHEIIGPAEIGALIPTGRGHSPHSSIQLAIIDLDPEQLQGFVQHTVHSFRVFYIRQANSFSRLKITKDIFSVLLHECQVFPQFKDFLIDFKWKTKESEVAPHRIKFRPEFDPKNRSMGRGFETAYIVRFMEYTNRIEARPWSLRQFAVYHKSTPDLSNFRSTWIIVGGSKRTEGCVDRHAESLNGSPQTNPFELHVMLLDIVVASWRPYLLYLLEQVEISSTKAVLAAVGEKGTLRDIYEIDEEDFKKLKNIEDKACDVLLCLDSTLDTVNVLADMYSQCYRLVPKSDASRKSIVKGPSIGDAILLAFCEKQKDVAYDRKKVEALLSKIRNTRSLISTLLERRNGYNLQQQMAALQSLQRQGQEENAIMRQLAEKGSRDSASVRILTIITLVYLPCTVVSSFYSTQFVNRKDLASGGTHMEYAQNSWLFFAVSAPLTFLTILIWWVWANYAPWITRLHREEKIEEKHAEIA